MAANQMGVFDKSTCKSITVVAGRGLYTYRMQET